MSAFVVDGGAAAADALCAGVRGLVAATSLGGVETTIERRQKYAGDAHVPPGLIRMSVGIEDVDDLWDDIEASLGQLGIAVIYRVKCSGLRRRTRPIEEVLPFTG